MILALYTYSAGLRAPALIAFVKDLMIYIVVLVAVILVPMKLGGYAHVFDVASQRLRRQEGRRPAAASRAQYLPYATLALGSAMAAFMYPHTLTGIFAAKSADTIRKNAVFLPAYTVLLGLIALLGYMAYAAGVDVPRQQQRRRARAVQRAVPGVVRRLRVRGDRDRRAGAGGGDVHRRGQPVHAQLLEGLRAAGRHGPRARRRSPSSCRWW